jgi:hypothetical protein
MGQRHRSRLRFAVERLALIGAIVLAARATHSAASAGDLTPFLGTWTYSSSNFSVRCSTASFPIRDVDGRKISISPGTDSDLVVELGCRCRLAVDLDAPSGAGA